MSDHHEATPADFTNEILARAASHERLSITRYHALSLRFLSFNNGISLLMEALADESRERCRELAKLDGHSTSMPHPPPSLATYACHDNPACHFFISNEEMAIHSITHALLEEYRTLRFYRQLWSANDTLSLDSLVMSFIKQTSRQCRILQECKEQLLLGTPSYHRQTAA